MWWTYNIQALKRNGRARGISRRSLKGQMLLLQGTCQPVRKGQSETCHVTHLKTGSKPDDDDLHEWGWNKAAHSPNLAGIVVALPFLIFEKW